jgi:hypothetical protein
MLLVEMPYEKHTKRIVKEVLCTYDQSLFDVAFKKRWNPYENRPIRDVAELFRVMRKIVNSDSSRLMEVKRLLDAHSCLIVFYNFDYELSILRGLSEVIDVYEWNGHKHETPPELGSWVYLVQYQAGAEGWNCTYSDAICFYSLTYSYRNFIQSQGRIDRLDTKYTLLYYYVFLSNSVIDKAIRNAQKHKKTFNERAYARRNLGEMGPELVVYDVTE